MGGLAAAGALALESWLLFGLAASSYTAAVVLDMWRPGFWRSIGLELRRRAPTLPEESDVFDVQAKDFTQRLAKARGERDRVLLTGPAPRRSGEQVMHVLEAAVDVERRAAELLARYDRLARYLFDKHPDKLRAQLDQVRATTTAVLAKAASTGRSSPANRELAVRTVDETLLAIEGLLAEKDALAAQIGTLLQGLEMVPHRILLATMREEGAGPAVTTAPLRDLDTELRQLEAVAAASDPTSSDEWDGGADVSAALLVPRTGRPHAA